MRSSLLLLPLLAMALLAPLRAAESKPAAKPNVVLILIDDMGFGDIGPFGSTKNRTPNLDRMAKEGMKLTSFYAAPVCSVSRAQVVTGCYGQRVSIPGVLSPGSKTGINKKEHTVAELLKEQGYATMCIGKWHLGDQPEFLPTRHGFDQYFGLPYSNDMIRKAKVNGKLVVPLVRGEQVIELLTEDQQDYLTERYTTEAIKFITDHKDSPFFLYLPHTAVHVPIHPGDKFKDKSTNGRYGDWVEEVDWSVGRILDTLKEQKLADNTLVMFSSDNGPWLVKGKSGGEAGPLRGGKGSTWEGGVREPTLAWWPGKIAPASVCDAAVGNIDFLPTFVNLGGGTIPADNKIDGKDLAPLLFGQTKESPHEARYYYNGYSLQAIRKGPWKMAIAPQTDGLGKSLDKVDASIEHPRLYNLDNDIGEQHDLAAEHPEVLSDLKPYAIKMAAELGNGKPGPQVRAAGFVANAITLYPTDDVGESTGKARIFENLKLGDVLDAKQGPQIKGMPITITCQIQTQAKQGVIVAQGGAANGYTLYLKEGHVVFAVRHSGFEVIRVTSPTAITEKAAIEARLAKDGSMTLVLDGDKVSHGTSPGLIERQPAEPFCVGNDTQKPVDDYDGKPLFQGMISDLKVTVGQPAK